MDTLLCPTNSVNIMANIISYFNNQMSPQPVLNFELVQGQVHHSCAGFSWEGQSIVRVLAFLLASVLRWIAHVTITYFHDVHSRAPSCRDLKTFVNEVDLMSASRDLLFSLVSRICSKIGYKQRVLFESISHPITRYSRQRSQSIRKPKDGKHVRKPMRVFF